MAHHRLCRLALHDRPRGHHRACPPGGDPHGV